MIHRREVSCREVMAAHLARIDERNPELNAIVNRRDPDELHGRGGDVRRRARRRYVVRLDARDAPGDQGPRRCRRLADHLGIAAARRVRACGRRARRQPDACRRVHRRRQDQRAGVRSRLAHVQRRLRPDAQRLRPRALGRRVERGSGGRLWPRRCCRWPTAATTWVRCATPRRGTTCSASARAVVACPTCPSATRSSAGCRRRGRWAVTCSTSPSCSGRRRARTAACPDR